MSVYYKLSHLDDTLIEMIDNEHSDNFVGGLADSLEDIGVALIDTLLDLRFPDSIVDWIDSALMVGAVIGVGFLIASGGWVAVAIASGIGLALTMGMAINIHNEGHSWGYAIGSALPYVVMDLFGLYEANGMRIVSEAGAVRGTYSHLDAQIDGRTKIDSGKNFTGKQKDLIREENKRINGGIYRDDITGEEVYVKKDNNPNYNRKTELQVDHIKPKSKGGSNSFDNAQVLSGSHNASKNANIVDEVTSKYKNRVEAIKKPAASGIIGGIGMEVNK